MFVTGQIKIMEEPTIRSYSKRDGSEGYVIKFRGMYLKSQIYSGSEQKRQLIEFTMFSNIKEHRTVQLIQNNVGGTFTILGYIESKEYEGKIDYTFGVSEIRLLIPAASNGTAQPVSKPKPKSTPEKVDKNKIKPTVKKKAMEEEEEEETEEETTDTDDSDWED